MHVSVATLLIYFLLLHAIPSHALTNEEYNELLNSSGMFKECESRLTRACAAV